MWKIAVADTAEDHLTLLKDALKAAKGALKQSGGSGQRRMEPLLYFSLQTGNTLWKVMK